MPKSSSSLMLYFSSALFRKRDAYAIVSQPLFDSCSSTVPSPDRDASVRTRVFLDWSKCVFSVMFFMCSFIFSNAVWCFVVHTYLLPFFTNSRKILHCVAKIGTNFVRWCTLPRKDLSCFYVLGAIRHCMASVLVTNGFIPCWLISNPSHSILFFAK